MTYKILLADDSITIQKVVELILSDEDVEMRLTGNGEEAFSLLTTFHPDIVLADTEMPTINGYELCERIKKNPATKSIRVILLTGAFEPFDEERARQAGADDFLIKPFEAQELIQKIDAALLSKASAHVEKPSPEESSYSGDTLDAAREEAAWPEEEGTPFAAPLVQEEEGTGATTEELIEIKEESEREFTAFGEQTRSPASTETPLRVVTQLPPVELPSRDEIREIFEKAAHERISSLLSSGDLKEALIASMTPFMKDSVEKILWDLTPEIAERTLREILKGSIESLTTEVQKVIWETVPEIAETMISQEIERIRSEF